MDKIATGFLPHPAAFCGHSGGHTKRRLAEWTKTVDPNSLLIFISEKPRATSVRFLPENPSGADRIAGRERRGQRGCEGGAVA
ncbi:hypothetical protein [Streptomyces sp. WZ-12]|uniref:hypothetical protein n=1 Tax=Streptomyces sp. WZ-12 TaxID=3030210 RepID=UPI002380D74D|nr:hypothetical protein [Streptomyces sp. WZ-12]